MARLFGLCVEKNSELQKSDKRSKFKYRVVFGGHAVIDELWSASQSLDVGSSPTTMGAGMFLDCVQLPSRKRWRTIGR